VVILASTPYYFFYAVNYLPNVPAISFSFVGLYYILLYRQSNALKHLAISTVFFSLSCLLKPTDGGLIWVAYFAPVMMNITTTAKINKKSATLLFTSLITVTLCIISWFLFVKWYNNVNGNNINLQGFYPIWEMSSDEILKTFQLRMFTSDRDIFQHTSILLLLIVFLIIYIVKWKSLDKFLRCLTLWIIIFAVIYSPLWFKAFFIHDYYMLLFAVPAAFLSITVIQWFEKKIFPRLGNRARFAVYGTLAGLMIISIYHNQYIQLQRYGDKSMGVDNPAIYEVEPYLRKIGISETDSVLSVPDGTPNITLSIFGNPGYTSDLFGADTYNPKYCKEHGIKYMIITDANRIHSPIYEPYTSKLIGEYKGIYIYDIR